VASGGDERRGSKVESLRSKDGERSLKSLTSLNVQVGQDEKRRGSKDAEGS
jgi:hypothetical protein